MSDEVEQPVAQVYQNYQFAPGEGEAMVASIRKQSRAASVLREEAATDGTPIERRRALRRRASEVAEAVEQELILLLIRVQPIFLKRAAWSFPEGAPDWKDMREDAKAEMAAEFARRVPSDARADHLFEKRFLSAVKYLAYKAVSIVWKNNQRDPHDGKPLLQTESLEALVARGGEEGGDIRHSVEVDRKTADLWRATEEDDLLAILINGMEYRLRSKDTPKQRAIGRRRVEAFCLRIAEVPYSDIAEWLAIDPRTERSDVEAAGAALTEVVAPLVQDGVDITAAEVITVLRSFGEEVERRFSGSVTKVPQVVTLLPG